MAIVTLLTDYNGKIAVNLTANRNIAKQAITTTAPIPSGTWTEYTQAQYDALKVLASGYFQLFNTTSPQVAYSLYSFDIIAKIEAQYGQTLWRGKTALADKIAVAKEIVSGIVCTASGRQVGSLKTLYLSAWNGSAYDVPVSGNATAQISLNKSISAENIDSSGYVHFLFYDQAGANQFMEIHYAAVNITLDNDPIPYTEQLIFVHPSKWLLDTPNAATLAEISEKYSIEGKTQDIHMQKPMVRIKTYK